MKILCGDNLFPAELDNGIGSCDDRNDEVNAHADSVEEDSAIKEDINKDGVSLWIEYA